MIVFFWQVEHAALRLERLREVTYHVICSSLCPRELLANRALFSAILHSTQLQYLIFPELGQIPG